MIKFIAVLTPTPYETETPHKLTLDTNEMSSQVLAILNDLKNGLPWQAALNHVPRRKIATGDKNFQKAEAKFNRLTAKGIRENYRINSVFDLLLNDR